MASKNQNTSTTNNNNNTANNQQSPKARPAQQTQNQQTNLLSPNAALEATNPNQLQPGQPRNGRRKSSLSTHGFFIDYSLVRRRSAAPPTHQQQQQNAVGSKVLQSGRWPRGGSICVTTTTTNLSSATSAAGRRPSSIHQRPSFALSSHQSAACCAPSLCLNPAASLLNAPDAIAGSRKTSIFDPTGHSLVPQSLINRRRSTMVTGGGSLSASGGGCSQARASVCVSVMSGAGPDRSAGLEAAVSSSNLTMLRVARQAARKGSFAARKGALTNHVPVIGCSPTSIQASLMALDETRRYEKLLRRLDRYRRSKRKRRERQLEAEASKFGFPDEEALADVDDSGRDSAQTALGFRRKSIKTIRELLAPSSSRAGMKEQQNRPSIAGPSRIEELSMSSMSFVGSVSSSLSSLHVYELKDACDELFQDDNTLINPRDLEYKKQQLNNPHHSKPLQPSSGKRWQIKSAMSKLIHRLTPTSRGSSPLRSASERGVSATASRGESDFELSRLNDQTSSRYDDDDDVEDYQRANQHSLLPLRRCSSTRQRLRPDAENAAPLRRQSRAQSQARVSASGRRRSMSVGGDMNYLYYYYYLRENSLESGLQKRDSPAAAAFSLGSGGGSGGLFSKCSRSGGNAEAAGVNELGGSTTIGRRSSDAERRARLHINYSLARINILNSSGSDPRERLANQMVSLAANQSQSQSDFDSMCAPTARESPLSHLYDYSQSFDSDSLILSTSSSSSTNELPKLEDNDNQDRVVDRAANEPPPPTNRHPYVPDQGRLITTRKHYEHVDSRSPKLGCEVNVSATPSTSWPSKNTTRSSNFSAGGGNTSASFESHSSNPLVDLGGGAATGPLLVQRGPVLCSRGAAGDSSPLVAPLQREDESGSLSISFESDSIGGSSQGRGTSSSRRLVPGLADRGSLSSGLSALSQLGGPQSTSMSPSGVGVNQLQRRQKQTTGPSVLCEAEPSELADLSQIQGVDDELSFKDGLRNRGLEQDESQTAPSNGHIRPSRLGHKQTNQKKLASTSWTDLADYDRSLEKLDDFERLKRSHSTYRYRIAQQEVLQLREREKELHRERERERQLEREQNRRRNANQVATAGGDPNYHAEPGLTRKLAANQVKGGNNNKTSTGGSLGFIKRTWSQRIGRKDRQGRQQEQLSQHQHHQSGNQEQNTDKNQGPRGGRNKLGSDPSFHSSWTDDSVSVPGSPNVATSVRATSSTAPTTMPILYSKQTNCAANNNDHDDNNNNNSTATHHGSPASRIPQPAAQPDSGTITSVVGKAPTNNSASIISPLTSKQLSISSSGRSNASYRLDNDVNDNANDDDHGNNNDNNCNTNNNNRDGDSSELSCTQRQTSWASRSNNRLNALACPSQSRACSQSYDTLVDRTGYHLQSPPYNNQQHRTHLTSIGYSNSTRGQPIYDYASAMSIAAIGENENFLPMRSTPASSVIICDNNFKNNDDNNLASANHDQRQFQFGTIYQQDPTSTHRFHRSPNRQHSLSMRHLRRPTQSTRESLGDAEDQLQQPAVPRQMVARPYEYPLRHGGSIRRLSRQLPNSSLEISLMVPAHQRHQQLNDANLLSYWQQAPDPQQHHQQNKATYNQIHMSKNQWLGQHEINDDTIIRTRNHTRPSGSLVQLTNVKSIIENHEPAVLARNPAAPESPVFVIEGQAEHDAAEHQDPTSDQGAFGARVAMRSRDRSKRRDHDMGRQRNNSAGDEPNIVVCAEELALENRIDTKWPGSSMVQVEDSIEESRGSPNDVKKQPETKQSKIEEPTIKQHQPEAEPEQAAFKILEKSSFVCTLIGSRQTGKRTIVKCFVKIIDEFKLAASEYRREKILTKLIDCSERLQNLQAEQEEFQREQREQDLLQNDQEQHSPSRSSLHHMNSGLNRSRRKRSSAVSWIAGGAMSRLMSLAPEPMRKRVNSMANPTTTTSSPSHSSTMRSCPRSYLNNNHGTDSTNSNENRLLQENSQRTNSITPPKLMIYPSEPPELSLSKSQLSLAAKEAGQEQQDVINCLSYPINGGSCLEVDDKSSPTNSPQTTDSGRLNKSDSQLNYLIESRHLAGPTTTITNSSRPSILRSLSPDQRQDRDLDSTTDEEFGVESPGENTPTDSHRTQRAVSNVSLSPSCFQQQQQQQNQQQQQPTSPQNNQFLQNQRNEASPRSLSFSFAAQERHATQSRTSSSSNLKTTLNQPSRPSIVNYDKPDSTYITTSQVNLSMEEDQDTLAYNKIARYELLKKLLNLKELNRRRIRIRFKSRRKLKEIYLRSSFEAGEDSNQAEYIKNLSKTKDQISMKLPDCFIFVYAVNDRASFEFAQFSIKKLRANLKGEPSKDRVPPTILVANKVDLERSKVVKTEGPLFGDVRKDTNDTNNPKTNSDNIAHQGTCEESSEFSSKRENRNGNGVGGGFVRRLLKRYLPDDKGENYDCDNFYKL